MSSALTTQPSALPVPTAQEDYPNWQSAALGGNLLSYAIRHTPGVSDLVPGYSTTEPTAQKLLDYGSIPARLTVNALKATGYDMQNAMEHPDAPGAVTKALLDVGASTTPLGELFGTGEAGLLSIPAWHGSRHEFSAFDNSAIGTGEGAQAYGWGHYVTGNKSVAKSYMRAGLDDTEPQVLFDGKLKSVESFEETHEPHEAMAVAALYNANFDVAKTKAWYANELAPDSPRRDPIKHEDAQWFADQIPIKFAGQELDPEQMDNIRINSLPAVKAITNLLNIRDIPKTLDALKDDLDYLDEKLARNTEDPVYRARILSQIDYKQQSIDWLKNNAHKFEIPTLEDGRKAAEAANQKVLDEFQAQSDWLNQNHHRIAWVPENKGNLYSVTIKPDEHELLDWDKPISAQSEQVKSKLAPVLSELSNDNSLHLSTAELTFNSGGSFYDVLTRHFDNKPGSYNPYDNWNGKRSDRLASERLHEVGVPGLKFADRNSRSLDLDDPERTHNYVIFDPSNLNIETRNGKKLGLTAVDHDPFAGQ